MQITLVKLKLNYGTLYCIVSSFSHIFASDNTIYIFIMKDNNNKSVAALTHLSVFSQYIIPFGNFIVPLIIWLTNKKDELVNHHGKGVINFQLSIFLYSIIASIITLPIFLFTIFKNMSLSHLLDDPDYVIEHISIANLSGI